MAGAEEAGVTGPVEPPVTSFNLRHVSNLDTTDETKWRQQHRATGMKNEFVNQSSTWKPSDEGMWLKQKVIFFFFVVFFCFRLLQVKARLIQCRPEFT